MATGDLVAKYGTSTAFTITLAGLTSSTPGPGMVGRQTTMVDNTTTRFTRVRFYAKIKLGTSPTGSRGIYIHGLFGDKDATTPHRTDAAGASDAGLTILTAPLVKSVRVKASPSTGDVITFEGIITDPGPEFGLFVGHDTVAAFDATGTNFYLRYVGIYDAVL